jgi:hypothetical protein
VQLHLGEFEDFKFGDKLLLCGGTAEVADLAATLAAFVASGADAIAIHPLAIVLPSHPAKLYAVASRDVSVDGHAWLCNTETLPEVHGKLSSLSAGHHYFGLEASGAELLVSVGEYNLAWWQAQA